MEQTMTKTRLAYCMATAGMSACAAVSDAATTEDGVARAIAILDGAALPSLGWDDVLHGLFDDVCRATASAALHLYVDRLDLRGLYVNFSFFAESPIRGYPKGRVTE